MNKRLTTVVIVLTLAMLGTTAATAISQEQQQANAVMAVTHRLGAVETGPDVPIAVSGDNTYIAWWTNNTGNDEVNFRASTDGGATFADKINLSNSTDADSQDVEIAANGDNVIITWWERNQTANEPVVRISSDNGATFGPLLKLATNGTIGSTEGEG